MSFNSPIGALPETTLPNDQPWTQDFRFWRDRARQIPVPVSSAAAWLKGRVQGGALALSVAGSGTIVLSGGIVGVRVPATTMRDLKPGPYDFELQMTDQTGATRQVRGVITLIGGLG